MSEPITKTDKAIDAFKWTYLILGFLCFAALVLVLWQPAVRFALTNPNDVKQAQEARNAYNAKFELDLKAQQ